jgi:excisionase family DNA binding protein
MAQKCEQSRNGAAKKSAGSVEPLVGLAAEVKPGMQAPVTPLPPQVVRQIAELVRGWSLGDNGPTSTRLPRLYFRPDEAAEIIGVSKRTLSAWQSARLIPFRRVGRTVLFAIADIQCAIDRYRVASVGEPRFRRVTSSKPTAPAANPIAHRKRRIGRIPSPTNLESQT